MKKNDLIKVIREIVKQELKKELPTALAQVFQKLMGGQQPEIHGLNFSRPIKQSVPTPPPTEEVDETAMLKEQLQQMFAGEDIVRRSPAVPPVKKFTSNPILNEVLNQTRPFNSSEKMAMRAGGAISPGVAMAAAAYTSPSAASTTGVGEMMDDSGLNFMKGVPTMPGANSPVLAELPIGQGGGSAPLEGLGQVSALDIKNHPALPESIKGILNRDYRSLIRAMDKKK